MSVKTKRPATVVAKNKSSERFAETEGSRGETSVVSRKHQLDHVTETDYRGEFQVFSNEETLGIIGEIRSLQRERVWHITSKNQFKNRLRTKVAMHLGYDPSNEAERSKKQKEADKLIDKVYRDAEPCEISNTINIIMGTISGLETMISAYELSMLKQVKKLPISGWAELEDQKGFGLLSLATLLGETGDLNGYANPGKVWRRMGLAPWEHNGENLQGATWRSKKPGLPPEEWEKYGYVKRRRSVSYLFGENLIKQNQTGYTVESFGPYKQRWLEAKTRAYKVTHKDDWSWVKCAKCKGEHPFHFVKKNKEGKVLIDDHITCPTCGGLGVKCGRAHNHGMLLATKMLLKNLWIAYTNGGRNCLETA